MANNILRCASCHKNIKSQSDALHALRETWHRSCFKCSICNIKLTQEFFSRKKDGLLPLQNTRELYCKKHFADKFKYSCHKCHKKITGLIQVSADVSFHPECFRCIKCQVFIGVGDDYVFEERSRLLCQSCHQKDVSSYKRYKGFRLLQHSDIHHVRISPSQLKNKLVSLIVKDGGIQKHYLRPRSYAMPSRVVSILSKEDDPNVYLRTGDTVLEINGKPVSTQNVEQFSELLSNTPGGDERRLSILIQRNPEEDPATQTCLPTPRRTPVTADPEKYQRNVSFFNFSVDRPTTPPLQHSPPTTRRNAFRTQKSKKDFDFLPIEDQNKILRATSMPPVDELPPLSGITRRRSFSDILSSNDDNRIGGRKDFLKSMSPLQRAQTLKANVHHTSANQVFRPIDLSPGEVIGKGAFGEVLKITDNITGKIMVMKKLTEMEPEAQEQFLKEVTLLKSLDHPNVLRFIGVMYEAQVLHIITEYIPGGTLRQMLKNAHLELSWKQRIEVARDIAAGMGYLHSQHVIHRDLKSKNILIQSCKVGDTVRKTAIVADFGLASVMKEQCNVSTSSDDSDGPQRKMSGCLPNFKKRYTVVGTCYWMAPEMLNHKAYNETADVFSFGIVVCEIISRVKADPDELPRTNDFGLDIELFTKKFGHTTPEHFLLLAAACCDMDPIKRPPFHFCEKWLKGMLAYLDFEIPLPDVDKVDFCVEPEQPRLNSMHHRVVDERVHP